MNGSLFTKTFWKDATERAIKTGAQFVLLVAVGGGVIAESQTVNAFALDWQNLAGVFLGGVVVSLLTSVASAGLAQRGTASLTSAVKPAE